MARLNNARSLRFPANSSRALMAQTCFASSGRFCPMRRPLFQGLYFGLIAGSWLLDMNCPPSIPPAPSTDTVSIFGYYQSCECPVSSASLPFVTYAANGSTEPIGSNVGDSSNGSYLAITQNTYYSGKTGRSKYCSRCRSMQLLIW